MLVHKNSSIKRLEDLQGKKSCHTGFGRNVGYKIPITKLRKHGIFKLPSNEYLPSLERELKGLSELFSESCLVGRYSPNEEINRLYSKSENSIDSIIVPIHLSIQNDFFRQKSDFQTCVHCVKIQWNVITLTNTRDTKGPFGV